jgi:hypothetical protein
MTFTNATKLTLITAVAALVVGLLAALPAGAIVPPRDCGTLKVGSRKFNIKSDQLRCTTAKKYADAYIRHHTKPHYYSCKKGASGSSLAFRCVAEHYRPARTFFAIKR